MLGRLLLTFAAACAAFGQPNPSNIKVSVNEVIVPVTVTDDKGKFVTNLEKGDFKVLEDGKEQTIQFFSREKQQPVVAGFLLDLSNNSRLHWKTYQEAARELVWTLMPGEKKFSGYLIGYHTEPELLVNTTMDSDAIAEMIMKQKP